MDEWRRSICAVVSFAPPNTFATLHSYIAPDQRFVACPNQDVVYGACIAAFDISPIVIQVADLGERFWVYQLVELRTDDFAPLGKMYGEGCYRLDNHNKYLCQPLKIFT